jgi:hypothetical protein
MTFHVEYCISDGTSVGIARRFRRSVDAIGALFALQDLDAVVAVVVVATDRFGTPSAADGFWFSRSTREPETLVLIRRHAGSTKKLCEAL